MVFLIISVDIYFLCVLLAVSQADANHVAENQAVEEPPTSKFTWTIESFSRLNTKKHYSEAFVVGGYKW